MLYIGIIIALEILALTAYMLWKRFSPQGVLLVSGILMLGLAHLAGLASPEIGESTGSAFFDIFKAISESFSTNLVNGGLMILAIGGYVAYMRKIKASEALAIVSTRPLSLLHRHPYIAATALIPIGQILFICIPSATGLAFLLAGTILPLMSRMGISKPTAVSAITLCTVFDIGPGSANSMQAASLSRINRLHYFIDYQLEYVVPLTILLMAVFYFSSKWFDRKDNLTTSGGNPDNILEAEAISGAPGDIFAILPVLPLLLLVFFSNYTGNLLGFSIELDIIVSVLVSLFVAMIFDLTRTRSFERMFNSLKSFWEGMGQTFASIITLIVCAEIFSKGLISLGYLEAIIRASTGIGLPGQAVVLVMTLSIFLTAMVTGSGNAVFFSFSPLMPDIASIIGAAPINMILPMQLSASIGRSVSPIAGVVIAISEIGGVSTFEIVKRNIAPVLSVLAFLLIFNGYTLI
ncbi:MAG: C4-dicarboxylate transporter DcuC [Candidatus Cryptobacteroides sp.]